MKNPFSSLTAKFTITTVIFLITLGVTAYLLNQQITDRKQFNSREIDGADHLQPINRISTLLSRLKAKQILPEDISNRIGNIDSGDISDKINDAMAEVGRINSSQRGFGDLAIDWPTVKDSLADALQKDADRSKLDQATTAINSFAASIGDRSNLILDQALDSYYLMDIILLKTTAFVTRLDQLTSITGALRPGQALNAADRIQVIEGTGSLNEANNAVATGNMVTIVGELKKKQLNERAQRIGATMTNATTAIAAYTNSVRSILIEQDTPVTAAQLQTIKENFDVALFRIDELTESAFPEMNALIQARVDEYAAIRKVGMATSAIALFILFAILFLTVRSVRRSTRELALATSAMISGTAVTQDGKPTAITFTAQDEIGAVGKQLTAINAELVKARNASTQFQHDAEQLLESVMAASSGDLTVRLPEVSEGDLGTIVASLSMMIENWKGIIGEVRQALDLASAAVNDATASADAVQHSAGVQRERVLETTRAIGVLNTDLQQVAQGAATAAGQSAAALAQASSGERVIKQAVQGADALRGQVQASAKRIKSMADSTTEIGEVLQVINSVANDTKLLAINAAIEAQRAGEAGRTFGVVAEAVRDLANKTQEQAVHIHALIKNTQSNAAESVAAIERQTTAVETEVKLLADAGAAQEEIKGASQRSALAVDEIAQVAQRQGNLMRQTVEIIQEVSQLSERSTTAGSDAKLSMERLRQNLANLTASVGRFTI